MTVVPRSAPAPNSYPSEGLLYDGASRRAKAAKILAVLRDHWGPDLSDLATVDVGCASGLITQELAPWLKCTVGIEYEAAAIARMDQRQGRLLFVNGDAMALPLGDGCMDLAICAQVYEHVPDAERLAQEIYRVLRPGGICFFSGPNRLDPIERHYGLPLVSWLPYTLANTLVRLAGKAQSYAERPRTLWGLKALWHDFEIHDYTLALLREPERFCVGEALAELRWVRRLPPWLLRLLYPLVFNYNWLLVKPD